MNRLTIPSKSTSRHATERPVTFRTDYAGNIPVPNNWLHIFQTAAEQLDSVYLQTRSTYSRLISHAPLQRIEYDKKRNEGVSIDGSFVFRQQPGTSILAKVDYCDCCGSPGRVSFFNRDGYETLQLCCPSATPMDRWASFVQSICLGSPLPESKLKSSIVPAIETGTIPLRHTPATLVSMLDFICDRKASIEATLETADTSQIREMTPQQINFDDVTISAQSRSSSVQIAFPAITSLRLDIEDPESPAVIVTGANDLQLITIRPTSETLSRSCFSAIVNDLLST